MVCANDILYISIILLIFNKKWKGQIFWIPLTLGREKFRLLRHFEGQVFGLNFVGKEGECTKHLYYLLRFYIV
jgi:hypothetical protein